MRRERKKRTISAYLPYLILWFLRLWRGEDMGHSVLICLSEHEARVFFFFLFKKQTITNDITILKPCCFPPICPLLLYLCVNVIPFFSCAVLSVVKQKYQVNIQFTFWTGTFYVLHTTKTPIKNFNEYCRHTLITWKLPFISYIEDRRLFWYSSHSNVLKLKLLLIWS